jgi:hypothetical protein
MGMTQEGWTTDTSEKNAALYPYVFDRIQFEIDLVGFQAIPNDRF